MSEILTEEKQEEEQMEFRLDFKRQYSDLALKEAVRALKVITREFIRFGMTDEKVSGLIQTISIWHPTILAAAEAIEKALPDD